MRCSVSPHGEIGFNFRSRLLCIAPPYEDSSGKQMSLRMFPARAFEAPESFVGKLLLRYAFAQALSRATLMRAGG